MLGITWGSRCQRIPSSEVTQITTSAWHSRYLNSDLILKPKFKKARVMVILLPFTVNWRNCLGFCGSLGIWWPPTTFFPLAHAGHSLIERRSLFLKLPWIWVSLWLYAYSGDTVDFSLACMLKSLQLCPTLRTVAF